eukprot:GILI01013302.1.p1 GENE.GILI01013302.1~~GILI01013302.1.p1  ORF type:complete len:112 (+),score=41.62 GILI01013302.1:85-420(+)
MRYIAAYLMAVLGGNENPSANDVSNILGSVGVEVDDEDLARVISQLRGQSLDELIAAGRTKFAASLGSGAPRAASAGAPAAGGAAKEEAKAEEKPKEKSASEVDMGFSLFD